MQSSLERPSLQNFGKLKLISLPGGSIFVWCDKFKRPSAWLLIPVSAFWNPCDCCILGKISVFRAKQLHLGVWFQDHAQFARDLVFSSKYPFAFDIYSLKNSSDKALELIHANVRVSFQPLLVKFSLWKFLRMLILPNYANIDGCYQHIFSRTLTQQTFCSPKGKMLIPDQSNAF